MKEANNVVEVSGILAEMDAKTGTSKEGKEYISINLVIKSKNDYNGVLVDTDIPVQMFSMKLKKDGTPNQIYQRLVDVKDNFTSLAAVDGDMSAADFVKVGGARIGENIYLDQTGRVREITRITANFLNKGSEMKDGYHANFSLTIVVNNLKDEIKNNTPTGRLIVQGIIPRFGNAVDVRDFIVEDKMAIQHIKTYWNKGDTVNIAGKIMYTSKSITVCESLGIGEPIEHTRTVTERDLIITSCSERGLEPPMAYDAAEIKAAIADREARKQKIAETRKAPEPVEKFTW